MMTGRQRSGARAWWSSGGLSCAEVVWLIVWGSFVAQEKDIRKIPKEHSGH